MPKPTRDDLIERVARLEKDNRQLERERDEARKILDAKLEDCAALKAGIASREQEIGRLRGYIERVQEQERPERRSGQDRRQFRPQQDFDPEFMPGAYYDRFGPKTETPKDWYNR